MTIARLIDGRPFVVTGSGSTIRIRDLGTGQQTGPELELPKWVTAVAVAEGHLVVNFERGEVVALAAPWLTPGQPTLETLEGAHPAGSSVWPCRKPGL